jgi:hypothetical protein
VTRRFFGKAQWSARINYMLNALLFLDVTVIIFSGLMISREVLPVLGIQLAEGGIWRSLHGAAADLFLALVGLHVALHWQWIVNMVRRYLPTSRAPRSAPQLSATASQPQQGATRGN